MVLNKFEGLSFGRSGRNDAIKRCLKDHPRKEIPAWGKRRDEKPPKGEFFRNPTDSEYRHGLCFVCKEACRLPVDIEWPMKPLFSISVEATCKVAAKRIELMFKEVRLWVILVGPGRGWPFESLYVNVSSCYAHRPNLLKLKKIAK